LLLLHIEEEKKELHFKILVILASDSAGVVIKERVANKTAPKKETEINFMINID